MRRLFATCGAIVVAGALGACGLIDPDITHFDLYVREKQFTIDTQSWMLADVGTFTAIDCSQDAEICAQAADAACTSGQCLGRCATDTMTCELVVVVSLWQEVNVDTENPELRDLANEPVVEVAIDAIEYGVTANTLTVATPPFTVFVAPSTTTSPGDPEARPIGTIPVVPAGTLVARTSVALTADGQATLSRFMSEYMTPFNILVGAQLVVGMGDPVPAGALTAEIQVRAHAGL
jgi:hypothetical protein